MITKMKIKKDENIIYDGAGLLSNGYWAALKEKVLLASKDLQVLVESGIRFRRQCGALDTGEKASIPDIKAVMILPGKDQLVECHPTAYGRKLWGDGWAVKFDLDNGDHVYLKEQYAELMENLLSSGDVKLYSENEQKIYAVQGDDTVSAVCMTVKIK